MYIIKQLKNNFCKFIFLSISDSQQAQPTLENKKELTPEQQKVEGLKEELSILKGTKKILLERKQILTTSLAREGNPDDKEYIELAKKVIEYQRELDTLPKKDPLVISQLSTLLSEINAEIQKKDLLEKPEKLWVKDSKLKLSDVLKGDFYLSELPEEITSISYNGKVYTRAIGSRKGEFISDDFDILKPTSKMEVTLVKILTKEDLLKKSESEKTNVEKYKTTLDKLIISQIRERGFDEKIMFEKVKNDILIDEEGISIEEDEVSIAKQYTGYPKDLKEINKKISESLGEERFNKGSYHTPKKILEDILDEQNIGTKTTKIKKALQPKIDLATKISPDKWAEKVSLESPELDKSGNTMFVMILNWIFKSLLGIDFFQDSKKDYDTTLEDSNSNNAANKLSSMVGGADSQKLGSLSEYFESGGKGPMAINGDDGGTPSFGTYQLHEGALENFAKENGIEGNHREKGKNSKFAKNWIAKVNSMGLETFKEKEHEFIQKTHYEPQIKRITAKTGVNPSNFTMSLKNAIWSTSVQHGPATNIVIDAIKQVGINIDYSDLNNQKKLIENIYAIRKGIHSNDKGRYEKEKYLALQSLTINTSTGSEGKDVPKGSEGKDIPRGIQSFGIEHTKTGTTACSLTAYKNLTQILGVEGAERGHAHDLLKKYEKQIDKNFMNGNGKIADLYIESKSNVNYKHRAAAFKDNGNWYVLDPYLPINGKRTRNPIKWEDYSKYLKTSGREFYGARVM